MEMNGCSYPYCSDRIAKYIQTTLLEHNMSYIKCPNIYCNVLLDAPFCQSILPKNVSENWCFGLCELAALLDSSKGGFSHGRSYCPNRECSELVLNECARGSPFSNAPKFTNQTVLTAKTSFVSIAWFHRRSIINVFLETRRLQ
ncbi:hypothetical protein MKX01_029624 [Papaver californicum]|nr:hypothetical protein MKX01_029624 [Papaver californicum]